MKNQACTFFGHRDCTETVCPILRVVLEELIRNQGVTDFYVGNQGQFDQYVYHILCQLRKIYPHIRCAVVLSRMPRPGEASDDTMFPEGLELAHPRFAIVQRNQWMIAHADIVVTHVLHGWGGAARFAEEARKKKKTVINIDPDAIDSLPDAVLKGISNHDAELII